MAEGELDPQPETGGLANDAVAAARPRWGWLLAKYLLGVPAVLAAALVAALLVLDTAIGHRFLADTVADWEAQSGLHIRIGRIEGSVYRKATLEDVAFSDTRGVFLRLPVVQLDWRPLAYWHGRIDIRELASRRGTLLRVPEFRVTEPSASLLPDIDLRLDRLSIERLTIAPAVLGTERTIDLWSRANLRARHVYVGLGGRLGGGDRLSLLVDADEKADRFNLGLDLAAPKKGLIARLAGVPGDTRTRIAGRGRWHAWTGGLLAEQGPARLAALRLTMNSGRMRILGQVHPAPLAPAAALRLLGQTVALDAEGTLDQRLLSGHVAGSSAASTWRAEGGVDLGADNAFHALKARFALRDPHGLGPGNEALGLHGEGTVDGPLKRLNAKFRFAAQRLTLSGTRFDGLAGQGEVRRHDASFALPLELTAARVVTGNATLDPRLVHGRAHGALLKTPLGWSSEGLAVDFPGLSTRLALRRDAAAHAYALTGPLTARGLALSNVGTVDLASRLVVRLPDRGGWGVHVAATGRMAQVANSTITTLVGTGIGFSGEVVAGSGQALLIPHAQIHGSLLDLALSGRQAAGGRTLIDGKGRHQTYGSFTASAELAADGPHVKALFQDPFPQAGVKDMAVALAPMPGGFRIDTNGQSSLGPFDGTLGLELPANGIARVAIERLRVSDTDVTGSLLLQPAGPEGTLALAGGGVKGTLALAPKDGGEALDLALDVRDAHFGSDTPLTVGQGHVEAHGLIAKGHTTLTGSANGAGIGKGRLFLGRFAVRADLKDGNGRFTAALAGRRGSRFDLQLLGDIAPDRYAVAAAGSYAGQKIAMPRRAVFTREDGGWRLAPSEIDFDGGKAIASGLFGAGASALDLALADMPLSLGDVVFADLGLGGLVSGRIHYQKAREGLPTGEVKLMLRNLTRSGLVLTSRPIDLALVGRLSDTMLEARAVASEGGKARGRLQARIGALGAAGDLGQRLRTAPLFAQLRYDGPADAIWRLMAIDTFDLTGPLGVAADISGTADAPVIRGSLAGQGLRLQSALTGTDISDITLQGGFTGSQLTLARLEGHTSGNGTVVGSGSLRFDQLSANRGPGIDIRLGARNAMLLSKPELALAATGPIRILSDGETGTIAGRLSIDNARWRLGRSAAASSLPDIPTREINRSADVAPASVKQMPWRFVIDAAGPNRIRVEGLGIDSEWGADIRLRGTVDNPAIGGRAFLVAGQYEFAGKRFDLTRGQLSFDGTSPPDPRLDIAATSSVNGVTATVTVGGTSLHPEIGFSSIPALPEEELLSRLLFGDSITQISATEAVQLGAALASLHGGGGLDPINKLRSAIGLDRLRIVNADPTLNRQTGVAAGKYLGRHFYAEIVSDGRGYSATNLEFRVTSWLSLLGTMSTVGRQSVNAKISKDY